MILLFSTFVTILLFGGYVTAQTQDQNFTFPAGGEFLDVGSTVILKWNNKSTNYPSVTIVLWNPTADGLYWPLNGLDFITNVGFVQWTVPEIVGQHKLGIGNGPAGGLANSSESKVFTIRRPIVTTTRSESSTTTASSASESGKSTSTGLGSTNTLFPGRTPAFANGKSGGQSVFQHNTGLATTVVITILSALALLVT